MNGRNVELLVFGKENCPYCDKAKALLEEYEVNFEYRDISDPDHFTALKRLAPDATTVPQIFAVDGTGVPVYSMGGYEELRTTFEKTMED